MDIRVADHLRNRFNIKVRRHQKAYGFTDPPVQQVLNRRESILLFYNVTQVIRTDEKVPRQKAQRKRLHIVCVNISDNLIRKTSIGGKILLRRHRSRAGTGHTHWLPAALPYPESSQRG